MKKVLLLALSLTLSLTTLDINAWCFGLSNKFEQYKQGDHVEAMQDYKQDLEQYKQDDHVEAMQDYKQDLEQYKQDDHVEAMQDILQFFDYIIPGFSSSMLNNVAKNNYKELAKLLVKAGIDLDKDYRGRAPAYQAFAHGNYSLAAYLGAANLAQRYWKNKQAEQAQGYASMDLLD